MRNENISKENISTKQILQERESVKNISKENRIEFSGKLQKSVLDFVYVVIIFLLLAKQFFMSIRLSQLDSKVRILTEQVALNEEKVEREYE